MPTSPNMPLGGRDAILVWYREAARPLAFRGTRDPYAILVSEAMAQQTQAARAAQHWERFMERFPTVVALAEASPADVLRAWQGLGYDRRALALWRTARIVMHDYGGQLPATVAELQALPGVGPYTARAVAALAFDLPVGAVDVNVRRVLGRIVAGDPATLGPAELQRLADEAVPASGPGEWTHAVMDLGATVCRPRAPRCTSCPARAWCRYTTRNAEAAAGATSWNADGAAAGTAAGAVGGSSAPRRQAVREPPAPFASTTRWLRGRILDRLRAAPDGVWVELPDPIGSHHGGHVRATAIRMAADGLLELDDGAADGLLRARLPLG